MSNVTPFSLPESRRETRQEVEMFAHLQRDAHRFTVMLKDLTRHGARIEGVSGLVEDEAVSLALPGRKSALAFVAWSNEHCAGLEFADPLCVEVFDELVGDFAVNRSPAPEAAPSPASDGALAA